MLVLLALKFHSDSGLPIRDSIFFLLPARLDEFSTRFNLATYACPCTLVHTTWMSARARMYKRVNTEDGRRIARKIYRIFRDQLSFQSYTYEVFHFYLLQNDVSGILRKLLIKNRRIFIVTEMWKLLIQLIVRHEAVWKLHSEITWWTQTVQPRPNAAPSRD